MADLPILDEIDADIAIAEATDHGVKLVIEKVEDLTITPSQMEADNSPFVKDPPLVVKKKRALSEKQIAHLAKMTETRKAKKLIKEQKDAQKLLDKAEKTKYKQETKAPPKPIAEAAPSPLNFDPDPLTEEEMNEKIIEDDREDFMKFIGNMERWKSIKHIIRPKAVKAETKPPPPPPPVEQAPVKPKKIPNALLIPKGDDYSYCFN